MVLRIIEMAIANLFVSAVAIRVFRTLRSGIRHLDIAIFGFLWLYTATLYTLILGIFGLLEPHRIAIISAICLIPLAISARKSLRQSISRAGHWFRVSFINSLRNIFRSSPSRLSIVGIFLCFLAFLQLARIFFYIWFVPPYVWDTMVYHLVNVAEWVQKGRIHHVINPVGRIYWPANFEVLEAWFVVFLHNDLLVKVAPFLAYLVAGASAYAIARVLNLNRILSASVAIFYLFTPSLAVQATACKNDVSIAAVYLLMIAILLDLLRNGRRESFPLKRQLLILTMAFCLGIGTKPYIVFIAPALILIGLAAVRKHRLLKDIRGVFRFDRRPSIARTVLCICLILGSALLGSYWFIRNYVVFDNPLHPTDFRIAGHLVFGTGDAVQFGPGQRGSASLESLWENSRSLVTDKIFDQHGAFDSSLSNITGWGWFVFVCGLPALVYALIFVRELRLLIISFIISLLGLFTFVSVDPWYMRFTLWFPIVFALSFAFLLSNLSYRWLKAPLIILALSCTMLNWIGVLNVREISVDDFRRMMQLPALERSTAELTHHYEGAYTKTLQIVPEDETIGFCFPNNGWAYPLYDSDLSRNLKYVPVEDLQFTQFMKQQNIRYLFIERLTPEQTQLIQQAVQEGPLRKIEEFLYALEQS
ncbi:hypothetical protein ACFL6S_09640 [Candidatus Poribacteria bacterium]